jgi:hypothetical protein
MPTLDLDDLFKKHEDEYLKFDRISKPSHPRPDVCAFLLLHELCPNTKDMVAAAEHDEVWLQPEPDELAENATEEDIITLIRCGVRLDSDVDSLAMFV